MNQNMVVYMSMSIYILYSTSPLTGMKFFFLIAFTNSHHRLCFIRLYHSNIRDCVLWRTMFLMVIEGNLSWKFSFVIMFQY